MKSFVTANVIIAAVHREYLEAFQSPATFANREILRSSRFYFLLSKVVLAQKKDKSAQSTKDQSNLSHFYSLDFLSTFSRSRAYS